MKEVWINQLIVGRTDGISMVLPMSIPFSLPARVELHYPCTHTQLRKGCPVVSKKKVYRKWTRLTTRMMVMDRAATFSAQLTGEIEMNEMVVLLLTIRQSSKFHGQILKQRVSEILGV